MSNRGHGEAPERIPVGEEVIARWESLNPEVLRLARAIGLDVEDLNVLDQLAKPWLNTPQLAKLLRRERSAMQIAITRGTLRAEPIEHGDMTLYRIRPLWYLEWAAKRPERYRYVGDEEGRDLAERYAREDAERARDGKT